MRTAAERRATVLVGAELRLGAILDVQNDHPGIAPGKIGGVSVNDGMMQALPTRRIRDRGLASGGVHSGQPIPPRLPRPGGIAHVNGDEDVVREPVYQGRGVSPASAG